MKNKKITLESTVLEFNKWREKRKTCEPVPDELWDMVAQIYDHYPHTVICQKLNLRIAQLKAKGFEPNSQDFISSTLEEDEVSPFVHVPATVDKKVASTSSVSSLAQIPSVEIQRPDGTNIIFKHHDTAQLTLVLQQLLGA